MRGDSANAGALVVLMVSCALSFFFFFFFNDTATTEIYTLSLHDALPISAVRRRCVSCWSPWMPRPRPLRKCSSSMDRRTDRKSTRLNSSHGYISYAVFCLKKKKNYVILQNTEPTTTTERTPAS